MVTSERPWVIIGTGAMACLFGAHLAPRHPVCLLGTWSAGLQALRDGGIRFESDEGERVVPVGVANDPDRCRGAELVLVLVKAWQTERAAEQLTRCLADDGLAVSLQNGLGNVETLRAVVGSERATVGVTTLGATLVGPGHVRAGGRGRIYLGNDDRLEPLKAAFVGAGLDVDSSNDLQGLVWGKLAVNAGINPLTALLGVPNGELLARPAAREILARAVDEVARVAEAGGIRLSLDDPVEATLEIAGRTANNRSSMLQDLERGAPTEVDAINGAVVAEGRRLGVPTPVNWALWKLIRAHVEKE